MEINTLVAYFAEKNLNVQRIFTSFELDNIAIIEVSSFKPFEGRKIII